ncbi:MAG: phosphoadenylyl-sulfate reductase [Thaumarchaeota archaeon]|nr:phosphoadenylyl-sulfate reductase [Nitrososphaerota archaeon]RNJ72015.1 MAG: phosphoadenylyl-sulfate reductase [Thaumarchaeota archaeon S13]RNJ73207.1 MAG: phosphoadenylyl-sulfate reductase [Thaumarchaeota archaeon S14]MDD9809290.1 phosphoadenylyl-sulfate reductase [Nitrososphaerota archaeon]MDD9813395.1 phosphoadenylyl-sulfate reductase [Nitrososphaerota archaeon]
MRRFTQAEVDEVAAGLHTPQETLEWALGELHPRIAKASSLGAEDSVIIHMMAAIRPDARLITLDTGRLNEETYAMMETMRERYGVRFEVAYPDSREVSDMVNERGVNLFYESVENRVMCCGVRKVSPLRRALAGLDAWITGVRAGQTENRRGAARLEIDGRNGGILKVNPLVSWTWDDVWSFIKKNDIPYHPLLDRGYMSIGCEPCTRAVSEGEGHRDGRWWWEGSSGSKECGLHMEHGA